MRFRGVHAAVSAAGIVLGLLASTGAAQARVKVTVDLTTQRMHVTSASGSYTWKVSTGRGRHFTPLGTYRPTVMRRMHYSRKYNNSPMPYSVFFRGGYAIHGTNYVSRLGMPASHGCIRLATPNAAKLYAMIKREGARITIVGSRAKFYANHRVEQRKIAAARKARLEVAHAKRNELRQLRRAKLRHARAERKKLRQLRRAKLRLAKAERYKARQIRRAKLRLARAERNKLRKLRRAKLRLAKAKRYKSKKYYAKRYKSKKYYAKRYKKKRYAKKYRTKRSYLASKRYKQRRAVAAKRSRSAPLAYAPQRRSRSTFDFFRNPNRY